LIEKNDIVTGQVCHIRARSNRGPRYDPKQTDVERSAPANLILLCSRHHKIVDDLPETYTVDLLCAMKRERESTGDVAITPEISRLAGLLQMELVINIEGDFSVSTIRAEQVTIRSSKTTRFRTVLPEDVIGASSSHRTYLKYLIDRYNEFAKEQKGRDFSFAVVYRSIKHEFKADWEWIPLSRFQDAVLFMQTKIDHTLIGRQRKRQDKASYEEFNNYSAVHR
jgi:hypothetical protein